MVYFWGLLEISLYCTGSKTKNIWDKFTENGATKVLFIIRYFHMLLSKRMRFCFILSLKDSKKTGNLVSYCFPYVEIYARGLYIRGLLLTDVPQKRFNIKWVLRALTRGNIVHTHTKTFHNHCIITLHNHYH